MAGITDKITEPDVAFWTLIGLAFFFVAAYVVLQFIGAIVLAIFLYYCTRPLYKRIQLVIENSTISAVLTIFSAVLPILLFFVYISSIAVYEIQRFLASYNLNEYQQLVPEGFSFSAASLIQRPILLLEQAEGLEPELIDQFVSWGVLMVNILSGFVVHLVIMLVVLFYLLKDDNKFANWSEKRVSYITPMWTVFWQRVDEDLHSVFFGNILNMILTGFIAIIVFMLYNLIAPAEVTLGYPVLFGIFAGLASIVPMIGMKIVYIPISIYLFLITLSTGDLSLSLYVIIFVFSSSLFVDFIPDLVIRPYVSGKNLHLGMLIFAYISGPLILGWYGFFLAPMILVFFHHFTGLMLPRILPVLFSNRI